MFPYQFDAPQPQVPGSPTPNPAPRRRRRAGTVALLAIALTGGAVGGGAVGTVAATHWLEPQPAAPAAATQSAPAQSPATQPIVAQAQVAPSNVAGAVYSAVNPAVVEVLIQGQTARGATTTGNGSGFVTDAKGLILTNQHVVESADSVTVKFSTGEERTAQVVGSDRGNDLALLRVELPDGITPVKLGDSSQVQVGETAIAIGSPFGLDQTVTQGIISAVDRNWAPNGRLMRGLIQTDTPINPGNSGGPLLNARGEVIGINTMIESPVGANVGVGFAVPIDVAKRQLAQLQAGATLEQGYMGVLTSQAAANTRQQGVTIEEVTPGSGAAQAGLRSGDVITAVDGKPVTDYESLAEQISGRQPGTTITVTITRNGEQQQVKVTLTAQPQTPTQ